MGGFCCWEGGIETAVAVQFRRVVWDSLSTEGSSALCLLVDVPNIFMYADVFL